MSDTPVGQEANACVAV